MSGFMQVEVGAGRFTSSVATYNVTTTSILECMLVIPPDFSLIQVHLAPRECSSSVST